MLPRALLIGGLAALALPAAASAATISTTATEALYEAAPGDLVELQVYGGYDDDIKTSATYFLPVNGNETDPTTGDANCRARPTGASSCGRTQAKLVLAERDDFVGVGAAGSTVTIELGDGDDESWSTGSMVRTYGQGGDDDIQGGPGYDRLDGGPGDDRLSPYAFGDVVSGGSGFDTVRYGGHTEPVIVTLDDVANDGRRATASHIADDNDIRSDVESVVGGNGDDELEGNAGANTLHGGDGGDVLTGNGGTDTLKGDAGADTLHARDGEADVLDCGPGQDTAIADAVDTTTSCEAVELPPADPAQPGTPHPAAPAVVPQPPPPAGPAKLDATVVNRWGLTRRATTVYELVVKGVPAGGRVEVRCDGKGCPFARRTAKPRRGKVTLTKLFAGRKLARGTVLEVRVTAPGMVGKVVRYTMRAQRRLPRTAALCLGPGAARAATC
jgi:hypothetical protein